MLVANLIERISPIARTEPGARAFERFTAEPKLLCLAVVDAKSRPVGLLTRMSALAKFSDVVGRALYEKRPVTRIMDPSPLIADVDDDIAGLSAEVLAHDAALFGGFIAVERGVYAGIGTGLALLRATADRERATARRLQHALDAANAVVWEIDFVEQRLIGAEDTGRIFGRPLLWSDLDPANPDSPIHPEDRGRVLGGGKTPPPSGGFTHRVLMPNGPVRFVKSSWRTTYDGAGAPLRMTLFSTDDTENRDRLAQLGQLVRQTKTTLEGKAALLRRVAADLGHDGAPLDFSGRDDVAAGRGDFTHLVAGLSELIADLDFRDEILKQAVDRMAQARNDAERANAAKSQFLANMSHELRTPLNAIIGYGEILLEDAETREGAEDQRADLGRILSAARHLLALINEVLDLAKIEAGRMEVTVGGLSVRDLIEEVVTTVQPLAHKNGNRLVVRTDGDVGEARTDALKLKQCLLNLCSNACKFTFDGEVELHVSRAVASGVDQLVFAVRDTGIGIAKDQLDRLFQPFVQADQSTTRRFGGTGLGLSITRRIAQLLGGDVVAESTLGEGSLFTLTVPARFGSARDERPDGDDDRPLVLMIEDEESARDLGVRALKRLGFAVAGVGSGEEGLRLARTLQPNLVLLDIHLPDRSGWSVLEALKGDPLTAALPVVVCTIDDDRARALSLGACDLLRKPVERDVLAASVVRFASRAPSPREGEIQLRREVA